MKDEYGSKDKLVDAITSVLERGEESKDDLKQRLLAASNGKLLRLHDIAQKVKEHGGKDKLVDAVLTQLNRAKDKDFRTKIMAYSPGRLLDMFSARTANKPKAPKTTGKAKAGGSKKKGKAA
jgi:hypothetical protein